MNLRVGYGYETTTCLEDPYADASIGNVTGSNSVNVPEPEVCIGLLSVFLRRFALAGSWGWDCLGRLVQSIGPPSDALLSGSPSTSQRPARQMLTITALPMSLS